MIFGQVAAPDEQELKKRQAQFREVMERFRNSPEYWEQRSVFERLAGEAQQSGGAERFRREIDEAASRPETRMQRFDMEWLVRTAAASFEKRHQEERLTRIGVR
jgi:hypothetical protein